MAAWAGAKYEKNNRRSVPSCVLLWKDTKKKERKDFFFFFPQRIASEPGQRCATNANRRSALPRPSRENQQIYDHFTVLCVCPSLSFSRLKDTRSFENIKRLLPCYKPLPHVIRKRKQTKMELSLRQSSQLQKTLTQSSLDPLHRLSLDVRDANRFW